MHTYYRLETPKLWGFINEEEPDSDNGVLIEGDLVDPDSVQIIIEDSAGKVVQVLDDMGRYSKGVFHYDGYTIPANAKTGTWHYEVRGTEGTKSGTGKGSFLVREQVA